MELCSSCVLCTVVSAVQCCPVSLMRSALQLSSRIVEQCILLGKSAPLVQPRGNLAQVPATKRLGSAVDCPAIIRFPLCFGPSNTQLDRTSA